MAHRTWHAGRREEYSTQERENEGLEKTKRGLEWEEEWEEVHERKILKVNVFLTHSWR